MAMGAIAGAGAIASMVSSANAADSAEETARVSTAESKRQFDMAMAKAEEAARYLRSIGVPDIEAQKIALQQANLGPSAMEDINVDPRLKNAQMDALTQMQQMGQGPSAQSKADEMMMMNSVSGGAQARNKAIMQSMAERGMSGSGSELAAQLGGNQAATQTAAMAQAQLAGQRQEAKRNAIMGAGQMAGQMGQQEYGQQSNLASARDRIAQFNESNRAGTANQQEIHNKGLIQQKFGNEMDKGKSVANALTNQANMGVTQSGNTLQAGTAKAQGEIDQGNANSQMWGNLAGAGMKAYAGKADGGIMGTSEYEYADGGAVGIDDDDVRSGLLRDVYGKTEADKIQRSAERGGERARSKIEALHNFMNKSAHAPDVQGYKGTEYRDIPEWYMDKSEGLYSEEADGDATTWRQKQIMNPDIEGPTDNQFNRPIEATKSTMDRHNFLKGISEDKALARNRDMFDSETTRPEVMERRAQALEAEKGIDELYKNNYADGGISAPNNNGGFAGGGIPVPESGMGEEERYLEGDVVPGESFEGDRVDAKVNSGEMVLNIEQQQRLMDLLKGLRDLKGLGDEDILESPDGKPMPPLGQPAMIPDGQQVPMAHGGIAPSEYKTPTEAKPRGIHASLDHERKSEEQSTTQSKERKARIKAYETLINGGK